jgi:general secretion pathway protein G
MQSHSTAQPGRPLFAAAARSARGFTLIEMLIVILIIGLVAGLIGPTLWNKLAGAQADTARAQMKQIGQALAMYRLDLGRYPDSLQGLVQSSGGGNWDGPYLDAKEVPKDPWGNDYLYSVTGGGKDYTIRSRGGGDQEIVGR